MGAPKEGSFQQPSIRVLKMGYRNGAVHRSLVVSAASLWAYLSALFVALFRAVHKLFLRYEEIEDPARNLVEKQETLNSSGVAVADQEKSSMVSAPSSVSDSTLDESDEKESPKLFLSFKFPTFEESVRDNRVNNNSEPVVPRESSANEEVLTCSAKELSSEPSRVSSDGNFVQKVGNLAEEVPIEEHDYHDSAKKEADSATEEELLKELKSHLIFNKISTNQFQFQVLSEKDLLVSDSDTESMSSSRDFSIMSRLLDSNSDGFFSDGDFEEDIGLNHMPDFDKDEDLREDFKKLEESVKDIPIIEESEHKKEEEEKGEAPDSGNRSSENSASHSSENSPELENEDSKLEAEWEHQDLIEQLRMEIRKVKATGLPTIAEDSESPRIIDDLKPWRIDEKPQKGDRISELHKVYKSYRERMRKFDILNYQKMYALGFLRTKDPFKSISSQKSSTPSMASLLSQTLRLCRENKKSENVPMMDFVRELHGDLETVYVGQLCLSWEFLHWQYEKALELWEADPYNIRRYNEVANEFQQLQVLTQRFLETEEFEGPRVQYYVKSRCFLRNLLQVPVIREDNLKVKKKIRTEGKSEFGVSSDMLVEILEESIRIFWRFVRADRDAHIQKGRKPVHPEFQDPVDAELFSNVQTTLQQKERKLKEVLKGGNSILRKFQKHHHDQEDGSSSDQVLAFFSQVDMKLVRRVLNMSRLSTDQLSWCRSKLDRINFIHRRIHVEPSFLFFPC